MNAHRPVLSSARVSRAGLGVAPKQSLLRYGHVPYYEIPRKVCEREDVLANTRDACAPQIS